MNPIGRGDPGDAGFAAGARRLGVVSGYGVASLGVAYLVCLVVGLTLLPSPDEPIADPWFTLLEVLILAMMPLMVSLMVAVHAWSPGEKKVQAVAAMVFMAFVAVVTSAVHFAILTLGRQPTFQDMDWLLAFSWPSVVYALDILAWDLFFPLSVLFAGAVFRGSRLANWIRSLLWVSGVLALAGLAGAFRDDMQVRNIGIVGYAVIFPVAAALMAVLFGRTRPVDRPPRPGVPHPSEGTP